MTQNATPENTRLIPMLCYDDAPAAIDFLSKAFGFDELQRFEGDEDIRFTCGEHHLVFR